MWRTVTLIGSVLLLLLALAVVVAGMQDQRPTAGASQSTYDLSWWTVDGGGITSMVGSETHPYALSGTIGQPDAAVWAGSDGYVLVGGFWSGAVVTYQVYLPLVVRDF
ncbi:MAG TPA: hypothetical protein VM366_16855 [Anaerolineae bacterium]|nr:hypothetical protein [Anaerolineae bacterium]